MQRPAIVSLLIVFAAGRGGLVAGQAPPSRDEIAQALEAVVSPERGKDAEARLRALVRQAPGLAKDELLRLRAKERALAELLGEDTETGAVDSFFAAKVEEARQAYGQGRYQEAQQLCEALLTLGAGGAIQVRTKRLLRLARDRAFAEGVLFVDLRAEKEVVQGDEPLRLILTLRNRSEEAVTIVRSPGGTLGQLQLSSTKVDPAGEILGRVAPHPIMIEEPRISVGPSSSWEKVLVIPPSSEHYVVERIGVGGQLVPANIEAGGQTRTRMLAIPRVFVIRVPEGKGELALDPLRAMAAAIELGDPSMLVIGTVLMAWEGEFEEAASLLLTGTAAAPEISETSYTLLRLLTGQNLGRDRVRWVKYLLSHEKFPVQGPLADW